MLYSKNLLFSLFIWIFSCGLLFSQGDPNGVVTIPRVTTAPVIDGEIDPIWYAQDPFQINYVQFGAIDDANDSSGQWYGLYDDANFYFLIEVRDQFLESEAGANTWQNDIIETYFNMDNKKPGAGGANQGDNYQIGFHYNHPERKAISANGQWVGIEFKMVVTDDGYRTEVKIPFATLTSLSAVEGYQFGFDIAINDNDGNSDYDSVTYWWCSNGEAEWLNLDGAGTVELGPLFNGNFAPELTELEPQFAFEGQSSNVTIQASDPNSGDTLSLVADGLPDFMSLEDNGDRSATLHINAQTGDAGIYYFEVTANDGSRQGTTQYVVIVKDPNVAEQVPVFEARDTLFIWQGSRKIETILVTDLDSIDVSILATALPDFATLEDNGDHSAVLTVNPGFDVQPGSYTVSLEATDETDNKGTLSFGIQVLESVALPEYYCDPVNGSMENDGSASAPWGSLEAVFDSGRLFLPGDKILLLDGYHGEPTISGSNADTVYIQPAPGASPRLSRLFFAGDSTHWEVSGLEISRSYAPVFSKALIVSIGGDHNSLVDCKVMGVTSIDGFTAEDWLNYASDGIVLGGDYILVENCEVLNTRFAVSDGGATHFCTIRGNRIQHFSGDGIRGVGTDLLVENNFIADNYMVDGNHDDGFQSWSTGPGGTGSGVVQRVTLRGNVILETTDLNRPLQGPLQGIGCFDGMFEGWIVENNVVVVDQWHGISLYGAIDCRIVNNTVIDLAEVGRVSTPAVVLQPHKNYNGATSDADRAYYHGSGNTVRNNLVSRFGADSSYGVVDNNRTIQQSDVANYFVNYPTDMRLKSGSPAIDAGSNADVPAADADGGLRTVDGDGVGGAVTDLGAYEFGGSWRGYPRSGSGFVDTGSFLGWLSVDRDPWVWAYSVTSWLYVGPPWTNAGGWIYIAK